MKNQLFFVVLFFVCISSCSSQTKKDETREKYPKFKKLPENVSYIDSENKTIHVFVALCDNKYQGIVPVPSKIGNGQDPDNNLYWGCAFGIRTFFKNSKEWRLVKAQKVDSIRLERVIFKHATKNYYLVADAYDGQYIKKATVDFLNSSSGKMKDTIHFNNTIIGIFGNSELVSYIGHDGLMDFELTETFENADNKKRDCIILACISRNYFSTHLRATNANPMIWTTGLMCPEAYTLHDALKGFVNDESDEEIRTRAALAYSKFQKCSEKSARNLLVTGW